MTIETLNKRSTPVLTEKFAQNVQAITGNLPNGCPLASLSRRRKFTIRTVYLPPAGWEQFFSGLELYQRVALGRAINSAKHAGFNTVGDIRAAKPDDQRWRRVSKGNGAESVTSIFLKKIFDPPGQSKS